MTSTPTVRSRKLITGLVGHDESGAAPKSYGGADTFAAAGPAAP
ncbi:hypothetical protein [Streptomyces sp. NBC_01789]|nr:hypothetical protein [Streptomyces sp. NBC_01789]MCX4451624.1 hypothetical protein [Streptomyces sp. NBC_01789]